MSVSENKKAYMRKYNNRSYVKRKKAEYMRKNRKSADDEASVRLVNLLREYGFEDWAFDFAQERAPQMLVSSKVASRRRR
jgi:hypothetical protein